MLSFRVFACIESRPAYSHLVGEIPTRSGHSRRFVSPPPLLEGRQTVRFSFILQTLNFQLLTFNLSPSLPPLSPLPATLMGSPSMCCKQKTYSKAKPFRCNIYAKPGVGVLKRRFPTRPGLSTENLLWDWIFSPAPGSRCVPAAADANSASRCSNKCSRTAFQCKSPALPCPRCLPNPFRPCELPAETL